VAELLQQSPFRGSKGHAVEPSTQTAAGNAAASAAELILRLC